MIKLRFNLYKNHNNHLYLFVMLKQFILSYLFIDMLSQKVKIVEDKVRSKIMSLSFHSPFTRVIISLSAWLIDIK